MKIALIGAGKRMTQIYVPLLQKLSKSGKIDIEIVGFTTRSAITAERFLSTPANAGIKFCRTRDELVKQNPDILLVCVNASATANVLRTTLHHKLPILVETPIEDVSVLADVEKHSVPVGVMEQWPFLPLEQFKAAIYDSGIISRPFLVQNDCRSYDYHAMAQLRTYLGRHLSPVNVTAQRVVAKLNDFRNQAGDVVTGALDSWEFGTVVFSNSAALHHQFSYPCKTAPFRSLQSLRAYSSNGTIFTGKMIDRENDYEIIDISYLSGTETFKLNVAIDRISREMAPDSISAIDVRGNLIMWENPLGHPLHEIVFTDNEVAMAMHLLRMDDVVKNSVEPLYTIKDAIIDQHLISAIKYACSNGGHVKFV